MAGRLRVTQTRSTISHIARNRATIRALGLDRIGHTVEIPDNPATRGMVRQVRFLVSVEEIPDGTTARGRGAKGATATEGRASTAAQDAPADEPAPETGAAPEDKG